MIPCFYVLCHIFEISWYRNHNNTALLFIISQGSSFGNKKRAVDNRPYIGNIGLPV